MWSCRRMVFIKLGHKQVLRIYENNRSWCQLGHTAMLVWYNNPRDWFMIQSGLYINPDIRPYGFALDFHDYYVIQRS